MQICVPWITPILAVWLRTAYCVLEGFANEDFVRRNALREMVMREIVLLKAVLREVAMREIVLLKVLLRKVIDTPKHTMCRFEACGVTLRA